MRYVAIFSGLCVAAVVVAACTRPVPTVEADYQEFCAVCHGPTGKGDGPAAAELARKPADLTTLSKRNKGVFPMTRVMSQIDGYTRAPASTAMPEFGPLMDGATEMVDLGDGVLTPTPERLVRLATYVQSLQQK